MWQHTLTSHHSNSQRHERLCLGKGEGQAGTIERVACRAQAACRWMTSSAAASPPAASAATTWQRGRWQSAGADASAHSTWAEGEGSLGCIGEASAHPAHARHFSEASAHPAHARHFSEASAHQRGIGEASAMSLGRLCVGQLSITDRIPDSARAETEDSLDHNLFFSILNRNRTGNANLNEGTKPPTTYKKTGKTHARWQSRPKTFQQNETKTKKVLYRLATPSR
jgi:hypothetical protein